MDFFKRKAKLEGKISKEFEIVIVQKVVVKRWEVFHQIIPPEQKTLKFLRENKNIH